MDQPYIPPVVCPVCKVRVEGERCECPNTAWRERPRIVGSPEDKVFLEQHYWVLKQSSHGPYWLGKSGEHIYLYEDGWATLPAFAGVTFDELVARNSTEL